MKKNWTKDLSVPFVIWKIFKAILYVLMIFFAITFLWTFIWSFINSFKSAMDYMVDPVGLPKIFDLKNYSQVLNNLTFKGLNIFGMLGNSLVLVAWNIFVCLTLPHMAGYVLARFNFKGRRLLESAIYLSMMVPVIGTSGSIMWFMNSTGLYDNFLGVFLIQSGGLGFFQVMLTNFYKGVTNTYAEAAYIDGASEWKVFTRIYYPQAKGLTMIIIIQTFISVWNDYMTGYLYLPSHPTLALGLQQMQAQFVTYGNDYPVMFAGIILSMIPVFILYSCFADNIMTGTAIGSMK